jgi:hypothetical protein
VTTVRKVHGAAASVDPLTPVFERLPPDEQPFPPAAVPDPLVAGRDKAGRVRTPEAARALARLPRRRDVLPASVACHPDFEVHYRRRLDWRDRRRAELVLVGRGHLSHGVGARLNLAAWLFAGSEFAAERAAKTGDLTLLGTAADLGAKADRLDWSAYHLAVREATLRDAQLTPQERQARMLAQLGMPPKEGSA